MGFIDSYKRLEQLCNSIYGYNHGISTYIDEMINTHSGTYYVSGWDEDLRKLKHYRWVRNKIVHEPGYTEENMCTPNDVEWINDFYDRILRVDDPLALYHRITTQQQTSQRAESQPQPGQTYSPAQRNYTPTRHHSTSQISSGCFTAFILGSIIWVAFVIIMVFVFLK